MAAASSSERVSTPRWARRNIISLLAILILVAGALVFRTVYWQPAKFGNFASPFAASSPWRHVIPPNPPIDPRSAAMIAAVQREPALVANLVEYGIPIYRADAHTATYTVNCVKVDWGICPHAGWPVLIPDHARPQSGSDGALVVVDEESGVIFEFWQAARSGDQWTASFGAVNSLRGSGWGGVSTGSGASRLGGVIRIAEIEAGDIPHALALQTSNACSTFRPPALKSDGTSERSDCIPEGARLQLDPSLDLSSLGLAPGELAVATAMQRYGGYVMDVSAVPLSVSFELDTDVSAGVLGQTYLDAGFRWDYDAMERIPWDKLRVLQ